VWWPLHDRHNRAWITSLQALLGASETCLVRFLTRALVRDLPAQPVVVDASVYASWFGAYLTQNPLHITLSSTARGNQASLGVETLLHEAGHTLTGPLDSALAETAARARRALPPELMHLMLFYTAGHAVRSYLPGHVSYAQVFGIWSQNRSAAGYYGLLEREWRPYLEGRRGFDDAIARVVGALPRQPV